MGQKKQKLIHIMKILDEYTDENHGMELSEIQNKLADEGIEVERKTLYKDFEILREAGFGIEKLTGESHRVSYYHNNRLFSLPEQKLLVDIVVSSKILTKEQSRNMITKLEKLGSIHTAKELNREVFISERPKTVNEEVFRNIGELSSAINDNSVISFEYMDWNIEKKLVKRQNGDKADVTPCFLHADNDCYYLIAYDGNDKKIKHYRVDKMRNIRKTGNATYVNQFTSYNKKVEYCNQMHNMVAAENEKIKLECKKEHIGILIDKFGASSVNVIKIEKPNGKYDCRVDVQFSEALVGWLIGMSGIIRLIGPKRCLKKYIETAEKALKSVNES